MRKPAYNLYKNEKGSVLVVFAFFIVAISGILALSLDMGHYYVKKSNLQNAVDAAALAGALKLPETGVAEQAAKNVFIMNGYSADGLNITFENNKTVIGVAGEEAIPSFFAHLLGKKSFRVNTLAKAGIYFGSMGGPFDYCMFSGNGGAKLNLGGTFTINGSVHSNGSLSASPSKGIISGNAEACKNLNINEWTTTVGAEVPGAEFIEMVDFSGVIADLFPSVFTTVLTAGEVNAEWRKQTFNDNTMINGDVIISNQAIVNGFLYVDGDLIIKGGSPVCDLNGTIYATGKITFENDFAGYGNVLAGGNITFNGGANVFYAANPVCIYSENGDIALDTGSSTISGIVYAPRGNVNIVGGDTTFYGSIIGDTISGIPANLKMRSPDQPFDFLPQISSSAKLLQ